MAYTETERRLTAIMAADVVGYSRLVEADQASTLKSLRDLRQTVLEPLPAEHRGRLVKLMGDGLLGDRPVVAVLPFDNMSDDAGQVYFSDGITEDVITELSRFRHLVGIARQSSFSFRGKSVDVHEIGRTLGAGYVVEGSVRRAGNRICITAQLIDATTGIHLWAERYDRALEDVFAV